MPDAGLIRRFIFGHPLHSDRAEHEKLGVFLGLPVFASDAISSVAYATQEILLALILAGTGALHVGLPISLVIAALVLVVAASYMQVIKAYPEGGGAYAVAGENLGRVAGLIAAAALLIDYVLTVAVSITSGIENFTSAWAALRPHRLGLSVGAILIITWLNLRGVRESAKTIAAPVFIFLAACGGVILLGLERILRGTAEPVPPPAELPSPTHALTLLLVLRAFSSGCAALTGIEAVSNGVTAFRQPETRNARITLGILAGILATFLVGITFVAHHYRIVPDDPHLLHGETVLSKIGRAVYGGQSPLYYILQFSTLIILVLAANTSFAGFPRVARLLARDGYLPRQLANLGDRLVFSNSIILLGLIAGLLVIAFGGSTHSLIPLYMIGVFLSFTLSQAGMFRRSIQRRQPGWWHACLINGLGCVLTGVVLCVVTVAKFTQGAWLTAVAIPVCVLMYLRIRRHYDAVAKQLSMEGVPKRLREHTHLIVVPVASLHRGTYEAVEYAESFGVPVHAVHVVTDEAVWEKLKQQWQEWEPDVPIVGLPSPFRSLVTPVVEYVRQQRETYGRVSVIIPEFVVSRWWEELLHNQSAIVLDLALRRLLHVSVVNFRYQLET